jgi:hypothetical protein
MFAENARLAARIAELEAEQDRFHARIAELSKEARP